MKQIYDKTLHSRATKTLKARQHDPEFTAPVCATVIYPDKMSLSRTVNPQQFANSKSLFMRVSQIDTQSRSCEGTALDFVPPLSTRGSYVRGFFEVISRSNFFFFLKAITICSTLMVNAEIKKTSHRQSYSCL